jgi:exodeoxyribonuclease-5
MPDPSEPERSLKDLLDHPEIPEVILSGPAGSGKTTLTAKFLVEIMVRGGRVAVTAPTHKALRVLRESLRSAGSGATFATLHSLLGLRLSEKEDGTYDLAPGASPDLSLFDWIVIDECSLVSHELLSTLERLRTTSRLLFVGDPHQLPPVSATLLDTPPVFALSLPRIALTHIHRQDKDHPLHTLTRRILEWDPQRGRPSLRDLLDENDDLLWRQEEEILPRETLLRIGGKDAEILHWSRRLESHGDNLRILAYTNRQVERYNRLLFRSHYGEIPTPFAPNERVLVNETTGIRSEGGELTGLVAAGEEVTVLEIFPERHPDYPEIPAFRVFLEDDSGEEFSFLVPEDSFAHQAEVDRMFREIRKIKEERGTKAKQESATLSRAAWKLKRAFAPLRHSYATTVFKAQGSTFDSVIVDWRDMTYFRDDRTFLRGLYVACTRPRHRLLLSGSFH